MMAVMEAEMKAASSRGPKLDKIMELVSQLVEDLGVDTERLVGRHVIYRVKFTVPGHDDVSGISIVTPADCMGVVETALIDSSNRLMYVSELGYDNVIPHGSDDWSDVDIANDLAKTIRNLCNGRSAFDEDD